MVRFEGPPHRGDLASNILLGATLLWLPLTAAAIGRAAFVKCERSRDMWPGHL